MCNLIKIRILIFVGIFVLFSQKIFCWLDETWGPLLIYTGWTDLISLFKYYPKIIIVISRLIFEQISGDYALAKLTHKNYHHTRITDVFSFVDHMDSVANIQYCSCINRHVDRHPRLCSTPFHSQILKFELHVIFTGFDSSFDYWP